MEIVSAIGGLLALLIVIAREFFEWRRRKREAAERHAAELEAERKAVESHRDGIPVKARKQSTDAAEDAIDKRIAAAKKV